MLLFFFLKEKIKAMSDHSPSLLLSTPTPLSLSYSGDLEAPTLVLTSPQPCKGKGVKEAKREKKENTDHETKNMYSLWVCAYMH